MKIQMTMLVLALSLLSSTSFAAGILCCCTDGTRGRAMDRNITCQDYCQHNTGSDAKSCYEEHSQDVPGGYSSQQDND